MSKNPFKNLIKFCFELVAKTIVESDKGLKLTTGRIVESDKGLKAIIERIVESDKGLGKLIDVIVDSDKNERILMDYIGDSCDALVDKMAASIGDLSRNQLNREAWLQKTLNEIPSGYRILDAGAGEQQYKKFCTHLQYVSQDFAKYDGVGDNTALQIGKWDQTNLDIVSDITAIPEPDSSFDAIMCVEVFEHLPNPVLAIREFARLLRPRGILVITAPFCSMTHFSPYHFSTGFNHYYYELHLEQHGFEIKEMLANGNYFEYISQETRRISSIVTRYTADKPSAKEILAMNIIVKLLERCSQGDLGSHELLNFGYHVRAEKLS